MPTSNLNPILEAAAAADEKAVAANAQVRANMAQAVPLEKVVTESVVSASIENRIAALTADSAALQTQQSNNALLEAVGGVEAQKVFIADLDSEQTRLQALEDVKTDIVDDTPTGIGLIDKIISDFRTIQVNSEISDAEDRVARSAQNIARITASQESFARVNATNEETLTEGAVLALDRERAALATGAAAEAELAQLAANSARVLQMTQADRAMVQTRLQIRALENQEIGIAWATEDRNLEEARLEDQASSVNRGLASKSQPTMSKETVERGLREEPERFQILRRMGAGGEDALILNGGTTAEVLNNDKIIDPEQLAPPSKPLAFLREVEQRTHAAFVQTVNADGSIKPGPGVPRNQDDIDTAVRLAVEAETNLQAANIKQGDSTNIFYAPTMEVLNKTRLVTDTAFYQKVMKETSATEFNTQAMWDTGIAAASVGSITIEEFVEGIDAYHTAAAEYNNDLDGGFIRQAMPNQMTYNTAINVPPSSFKELLITDSVSVSSDIGMAARARPAFRPATVSKVINHMNETAVRELAVKLLTALPRHDSASNTRDEDTP